MSDTTKATLGWRPEEDNVIHSLQLHARQNPNRIALAMHGGETRTYGELADRSSRLANALIARGLAKRDRVALWSDTRIEYMEVYLACAQAGFVVVPVNARFKGREAAAILADSGARALFYSKSYGAHVQTALTGSDVSCLVCLDEVDSFEGESFTAMINGAEPHSRIDAGGSDLFILGYTSGTSGTPKGAMLTHESVRNLGQTNALACRYALGSIQVFGLSISFSSTVPAHILPHIYVGGTTVMLPVWDTGRVIEAVEDHAANFLILPSPVIIEFANEVNRAPERVQSLVSVLHSASKAPREHLRELCRSLGERVIEGWGMTENSGGLLTATTAQDVVSNISAVSETVGRPVPDTEIKLIDESGSRLPHDGKTIGHLVAASRSLAIGYWGLEEATNASFQGGWYLTGDMGTIDRDGFVRILDRRTDMINSGGMNIYPNEVEQVLRSLPGVQEAVVVPLPHAKWGQSPVAYIVGAGHPPEQDMLDHCSRELAGYKRPLWIRVLDEMPRNAGGKIVRRKLIYRAIQETMASMAPYTRCPESDG
ncbi:class I adenylate-forming enzyme family protein [Arthrobacter sp. CC3]|uniref:class I adenylate-forming enzyme family protein n=1 Tax=Arthrobacter sp. CC3 TaxID=3029185 RepID=UPI003263CF8C